MTTIIRQCVGIDIAKDEFVASLATMNQAFEVTHKSTKSFPNTLGGFQKMAKWAKQYILPQVNICYVMEATGVYYENLAYWLYEHSLPVSVILPKQFKAYANSLNIKSKTDRIDARILGQMGLERALSLWQPVSASMRQLKQLCRERTRLKTEKTVLKNQLHSLSHSYQPNESTLKRLKKQILALDKLIQETEKEMVAALEQDPWLKERIGKVCSIKGIGIITAISIVAETNGFALIKNKAQLVCYAGYDVVRNESGTSVNGRTKISKKGNSHIGKALHFPALTAIRHDSDLKKAYERIIVNTKIKMKGVVALQRKILVLIYTLFKNNTTYEANHPSKLTLNLEAIPSLD
jgi:transposase